MTLSETQIADRDLAENFQTLFDVVQRSSLFSDSKTFSDAIAKEPLAQILDSYHRRKNEANFDLKAFIEQYFILPTEQVTEYQSDFTKPIQQHLDDLWEVLTRQPSTTEAQGSLIPLPFSYVVPGGRFREIYYWDSYFTMLGLQVSGREALVESMVNNFAHLIDTIGFIHNIQYSQRKTHQLFGSFATALFCLDGQSVGRKQRRTSVATLFAPIAKRIRVLDAWLRRIVAYPNGKKSRGEAARREHSESVLGRCFVAPARSLQRRRGIGRAGA